MKWYVLWSWHCLSRSVRDSICIDSKNKKVFLSRRNKSKPLKLYDKWFDLSLKLDLKNLSRLFFSSVSLRKLLKWQISIRAENWTSQPINKLFYSNEYWDSFVNIFPTFEYLKYNGRRRDEKEISLSSSVTTWYLRVAVYWFFFHGKANLSRFFLLIVISIDNPFSVENVVQSLKLIYSIFGSIVWHVKVFLGRQINFTFKTSVLSHERWVNQLFAYLSVWQINCSLTLRDYRIEVFLSSKSSSFDHSLSEASAETFILSELMDVCL